MVVAAQGQQAKPVTILGATGSIGQNTVKIIIESPEPFYVEALTAHKNVRKLAEQARQVKAKKAVIATPALYEELKTLLAGSGIEALAGEEAVTQVASEAAGVVMVAVMGAAGLAPTLAAIRNGATLAMANKECLVCAGELLLAEAKRHNATILPVDSEHNAIFQLFDAKNPEYVSKITLTASGGPFRHLSLEQMRHVTPAQATSHPNWQMGAKISVDSATMMNKGLELIEAHRLFPVLPEQIDIVVHPESVIHSLVTYCDGSVLAQLNIPDMCVPIAYALGWPKRIPINTRPLDLAQLGKLTFEQPDTTRFPALSLARAALNEGKSAPTILNAANEIAVESFIQGEIQFLDIVALVEDVLQRLPSTPLSCLEDITQADRQARQMAKARLKIGRP